MRNFPKNTIKTLIVLFRSIRSMTMPHRKHLSYAISLLIIIAINTISISCSKTSGDINVTNGDTKTNGHQLNNGPGDNHGPKNDDTDKPKEVDIDESEIDSEHKNNPIFIGLKKTGSTMTNRNLIGLIDVLKEFKFKENDKEVTLLDRIVDQLVEKVKVKEEKEEDLKALKKHEEESPKPEEKPKKDYKLTEKNLMKYLYVHSDKIRGENLYDEDNIARIKKLSEVLPKYEQKTVPDKEEDKYKMLTSYYTNIRDFDNKKVEEPTGMLSYHVEVMEKEIKKRKHLEQKINESKLNDDDKKALIALLDSLGDKLGIMYSNIDEGEFLAAIYTEDKDKNKDHSKAATTTYIRQLIEQNMGDINQASFLEKLKILVEGDDIKDKFGLDEVFQDMAQNKGRLSTLNNGLFPQPLSIRSEDEAVYQAFKYAQSLSDDQLGKIRKELKGLSIGSLRKKLQEVLRKETAYRKKVKKIKEKLPKYSNKGPQGVKNPGNLCYAISSFQKIANTESDMLPFYTWEEDVKRQQYQKTLLGKIPSHIRKKVDHLDLEPTENEEFYKETKNFVDFSKTVIENIRSGEDTTLGDDIQNVITTAQNISEKYLKKQFFKGPNTQEDANQALLSFKKVIFPKEQEGLITQNIEDKLSRVEELSEGITLNPVIKDNEIDMQESLNNYFAPTIAPRKNLEKGLYTNIQRKKEYKISRKDLLPKEVTFTMTRYNSQNKKIDNPLKKLDNDLVIKNKWIEGNKEDEEKGVRYSLKSIIIQSGGTGGGHYTSLVRVNTNEEDKKDTEFFYMNDSNKTKVKKENLSNYTKGAYILTYEKVEDV